MKDFVGEEILLQSYDEVFDPNLEELTWRTRDNFWQFEGNVNCNRKFDGDIRSVLQVHFKNELVLIHFTKKGTFRSFLVRWEKVN